MKTIKLHKTHRLTFNTDETIKAAALSAPNELVMLMSSGLMLRYKIDADKTTPLFSVKNGIQYSDGCFDIDDPVSIYTINDIVVVVNDFKCHGYIHHPGKYEALHFGRTDCHANITQYPIALFKNKEEVPHLIYSEEWNHLQIINLDTLHILTAAKSLIEEGAEQRHLELQEKYKINNTIKWPRAYDYFYGRLEMSPDQQHFLSAGWIWGSNDSYCVYNVDDFIHNHRITDKLLDIWEHCNRPACWVDNETVAVVYNASEEGEEEVNSETRVNDEIHFYKINSDKPELKRKVSVDNFNAFYAKIYFSKDLHAFVLVPNEKGLAVLSLDGEVLLHDKEVFINTYNPDLNMGISWEDQTINIYQIIK
ncbi:hypothetical protein OOZ15_08880 [Galbibacter sp. EGI 63066]|uniref:hypothetical protein n=1 Tax=Galbibacter sp. EGI 63066 TaxID=2993559 RepID=UPI002248B389|nr:hypothetical protein [Galbibacter sp. EGI 63066]MCX2680049.1 hypothetical protein [Galbibacter sp. EGI 63066]